MTKQEELKYLSQMLFATTPIDKDRLKAIAKRLRQIAK